MNDPSRQPGFSFDDVRLVHAQYELGPDAAADAAAELQWRYEDHVEVADRTVKIRQELHARIVGRPDQEPTYLQASVTVEGRFAAEDGANLEPADFAEHHAPAILFAFTREWLQRLTSAAGSWPAILVPPANVIELRKKKSVTSK